MSRQAILALESGTRRPYLYDEMLSLIRLEAARWATNRVGPPTWAQVRDTFLALGKEGLNEHIIEVLNTPGKSTEDAIQFVFDELQRNYRFFKRDFKWDGSLVFSSFRIWRGPSGGNRR